MARTLSGLDEDNQSQRRTAVLAQIRSGDTSGTTALFAPFVSGLRIILAHEYEPESIVRIIDQTMRKLVQLISEDVSIEAEALPALVRRTMRSFAPVQLRVLNLPIDSAARAGLIRILMSLPLPQRRALQMFYVEHTGEATASEVAGLSISRFSALRATVHQRFRNLTT